MTFVRVWRFRPAEGREREFARRFGPEGDWARLFGRDPEFLGTALLRSTSRGDEYLTIDRWATRSAWDAFRRARAAEYEALDAASATLTSTEEEIGEYLETDVNRDRGEE